MNRDNWIKVFLILSLISNTILIYVVFDTKTEKDSREELLENAIIINEFSERARELRNLKDFIQELSKQEDYNYPILEKQSDVYWELAKPMESIILKSTHYVLNDEYATFLFSFDKKYEDVIDTFKAKLPLMNREQLTSLAVELDNAYKTFVGKGEWGISQPQTKIQINFRKENLDRVIEQLSSIQKELQSIK